MNPEALGKVIFYGSSIALFLIGLYIILVKRNLIKLILGLTFIESGVNLFLVSIGYVWGRTAPILNKPELMETPSKLAVDPVPQALVLTAIVIGVAVTAMALAIAMLIYDKYGTLNISKIKELKW
ncbi:MAG: cation:proton antiporter [Candidatus Hydrothermota bacterium]|nr:MAG: cation:proton antiporter [Candidatus Hydrothermae bacterium]